MKEKQLLKYGWEFQKLPICNGVIPDSFEETAFTPVVLPHDWMIGQAENLYEDTVGWYRHRLILEPERIEPENAKLENTEPENVIPESAKLENVIPENTEPESVTSGNAGQKIETGMQSGTPRYFLRFEGVYMDCTIFVNGKKAGEWKYGYTTFEVDITEFAKAGENEILVKVVHQCPNSRWYTGAGIYRPVWLIKREAAHFAADGIYIHTEKKENGYDTEISAEVVLPEGADAADYQVSYQLYDKEKKLVAETSVSAKAPEAVLFVRNANEWSLNEPYLYKLRASLWYAGNNRNVQTTRRQTGRTGELQTEAASASTDTDETLLEEEVISYGYRTLLFTTEKGFFLNGEHIKLNGVCLHHDLGCLGSALNKCALRRQLALMQEMGANAIRTAHNMPAVELMELADEMGILVLSESFDCWKKPKNPYDYARFFEEWAERDVANWIRRDRNHPSVLMWSVGNEIYDTHADERGQETLRWLMGLVAEHDPKQNAPATFGSNFMPWENTQKCADIIKLMGYNYAEKLYEEHHKKHPDWMIYGSETSSIVQSRGIYHFPVEKEILADDDEQCSSLGNSITSWGAKSAEACIFGERDTEYSLGQFLWSGIDYLGEPTPYHGRNSYFGQADTACFKKDAFYLYQAGWNDYRKKPVLHIFPYWDFNPGQLIDVRVVSNAPEIELFLNGVSQGRVTLDLAHGKKLTGDWKLPYVSGALQAVAYDETGAIIAKDEQKSFGDAANICLQADRTVIFAEDEELVFVTITMQDAEGNPVENANNRVQVTVSGAGLLAGLDNGDSTDTDQYQTSSKRLFSGKLLAVVRSNGMPGEIKVCVSSEGLMPETLLLTAKPLQPETLIPTAKSLQNNGTPDGELPKTDIRKKAMQNAGMQENRAAALENTYRLRNNDVKNIKIPIRKIELVPQRPVVLNEQQTTTKVKAVIYPENADEQELVFRVTDDAGVDSTFASIHPEAGNSKEAIIEVKGDGAFRVRCMCKNGKKAYDLISVLEYRAEGLGVRNLNPYEFLSASLFSKTGGQIGNGNERGISTQRDGASWVAYENLDFGAFGSDEVEIPVFSFGGATPFTFWEGIPHAEGSSIIGRKDYTLPSVWNTYIPDTFQLTKRLRGITTFAVELDRKIHMKGFQFKKQEKAYAKLFAAEADSIYGDSYQKQETAITGIGNNVTLVFDGMDFGDNNAKKLVICGKTPHEVNNIRLLTEWEDGRKEQESLEVAYTEDVSEQSFVVQPKSGKAKISFVFLPGSAFDFEWFYFA